jgi:hypothetical protein
MEQTGHHWGGHLRSSGAARGQSGKKDRKGSGPHEARTGGTIGRRVRSAAKATVVGSRARASRDADVDASRRQPGVQPEAVRADHLDHPLAVPHEHEIGRGILVDGVPGLGTIQIEAGRRVPARGGIPQAGRRVRIGVRVEPAIRGSDRLIGDVPGIARILRLDPGLELGGMRCFFAISRGIAASNRRSNRSSANHSRRSTSPSDKRILAHPPNNPESLCGGSGRSRHRTRWDGFMA